jgi:hypothetical protein
VPYDMVTGVVIFIIAPGNVIIHVKRDAELACKQNRPNRDAAHCTTVAASNPSRTSRVMAMIT